MKAVKFKTRAAQGDMLITKIAKLPEGLVPAKCERKGYHVLAHSETGHDHVVLEKSAQLLIDKTNSFIAYLNVLEPCEIEHLRSHDTHKSIALDKGVYEIRRQREYTPEGFRKAQD
jgi:hypothetical protein